MRLDTDGSLEQALVILSYLEGKEKISESQQKEFEHIVHQLSEEVLIKNPAWTPVLAQEFLVDTYDIKHSYLGCRSLLKETRLNYQKSRHKAVKKEKSDKNTFHGKIK